MTQEQIKAKELVEKFRNINPHNKLVYGICIKCALIAVDEILIGLKFTNDSKWYVEQANFWQTIKTEIQKL